MNQKRVLASVMALMLVWLLAACATSTPEATTPAATEPPQAATPTPEPPPPWNIVDGSVASTAFGTFNGIAYVQYTGEFIGTEAGDYAVGFEIVAPENPAQGNGVLVMEPMHIMGGTGGRDAYLTPEFLFGRGFSYAGIWWHPADVNPMEAYSVEDANEILHNFVLALRQDPEIQAMVGTLEKLYGLGVSKTCEPLLTFLASPDGSLLDFSFLTVPGWQEETFTPPESANYIIAFQVEADHVRSAMNGTNTKALRGSSEKYRSYEIAGAPHAPDVAWMREIGPAFGVVSEGTTPLDWTPVMRALFVAGHQWVTEGVEPPPSTHLKDDNFSKMDFTYRDVYTLTLETGIQRDSTGNATGGIRLPDLALGRGLYIAVDPNSPLALLGAFQDLQCELLSDRSLRFADHADYVTQFTEQVQALVDQRFLLPEDAEQMMSAATASDVGDPAICPPRTGLLRTRLMSGGINRNHVLYVPSTYDPTQSYPLVFNLHWYMGDVSGLESITGMSKLGEEFGFILVLPTAVDKWWKDGDPGWPSAEITLTDEVAYFSDLIDTVSAMYNVDPLRIYVTGASNGGCMSYSLACELADRIAAIGPVIGDLILDDCRPSRSVPLIHIHGADDPMFKGTRGPTGTATDVQATVKEWAARNGCSDETEVVYQQGSTTCIAYKNCDENATVELCVIEGMGHAWPSPDEIDAPRAIWEFFAAHPMPEK